MYAASSARKRGQYTRDVTPRLLAIWTKTNTLIRLQARVELGDGERMPASEVAEAANAILKSIKGDMLLH